jgi:FMN phosphatase YigB (HAD superfamily)
VTLAVVFDLFETLVDYDDTRAREFSSSVARLCEAFHDVWIEGRPVRDTGPMAPYLLSLGIEESAMQDFSMCGGIGRAASSGDRDGVVDTLAELRRRGVRTGLITVCSEDVVGVWAEAPFAGLFDVEVFSCSCGLRKPDPRIYRLALDELGVAPPEALFVGDGANDELAGAERVGMRDPRPSSRRGTAVAGGAGLAGTAGRFRTCCSSSRDGGEGRGTRRSIRRPGPRRRGVRAAPRPT